MAKRIAAGAFEDGDGEDEKYEVISSSEAYSAIVRGEVDIQITTAKRYPRSISKFKDNVRKMACLDRETALACTYALPRAGKQIYGPSVRMAEICAAAWGNLRAAARVIGMGDAHLTCNAVCHDLETNVAVSIEVMRRITKTDGERFNDDMLTVAANAGNSIAYRNAVFKVIPKAYWGPIWEETRLVGRGSEKTISQLREEAFDFFAKTHKVKAETILARLAKRSLEDVDLDDIDLLFALRTSIDEGSITLAAAFVRPEPEERARGSYLAEPTGLDRVQEIKPQDPVKLTRSNGASSKVATTAPMEIHEENFLSGEKRVGRGATVDQAMVDLDRQRQLVDALEDVAPAPTGNPLAPTREEMFDHWNRLRSHLDARQLAQVRKVAGVEYISASMSGDQVKTIVAEAERLLKK